MGHFYPPPGPYVGGQQPYDPGRRVTPPQAPPNPPFGRLERLEPWFYTVVQAWVPPFPGFIGGRQPYDPGRRVTPPQAPPAPPVWRNQWLNSVIQAWQPIPQPQQLTEFVQPPAVAAATYVPPPRQYPLSGWNADIVIPISMPQLQGASLIGPTIDNPKPTTEWQSTALNWWREPWAYPQTLKKIAPLVTPVVADNPTPNNTEWMASVLQSWIPPFRYPQTLEPIAAWIPQPDVPTPNTPYQQQSLAWWYVPWRYPQALDPIAALIPAADAPAPNTYWQQQSLAWWYVPWRYPQTLEPIAALIPLPDNPPPSTRTLLNLLAQLWVPGPPQPYQLHQTFQIPNPIINDPPFPGTNWFNTVIAAWQPPPPLPHQLLQDLVVPGEEPPVPPEPPPGPSGGGPAWYYAYGCDEDDEDCNCRAAEYIEDLCEEEQEVLRTVVQRAVVAVKEDKPKQFKAAERVFAKEIEKVSGIVKADIKAIWRAQVDQRLREEDEELAILLAYFR